MSQSIRWFIPVLLVFFAACNGDSPKSSASDPSQPPAAPSAETVDVAQGKMLFAISCAACHGPAGEGVRGLGKDMTASEFIAKASDVELLDFVKTGRAADHPQNETGVLMPPKGGNPELTDEQLRNIIGYMRSFQTAEE